MAKNYRVGLIVPSSNTTMETEIPKMLSWRMQEIPEETFTFHSSRMRMLHVTREELKKMDNDSDRCAIELSDARCDVLAYACLVAIMSMGRGYHVASEERLARKAAENGGPAPVISSAGALVDGIHTLGAKKVALLAPYMKELTATVCDYIADNDIVITNSLSLEIPDNLEVGRRDPLAPLEIVKQLDYKDADAVVLSACVQMPSLASIQKVQDEIGKPVLSAATATVYKILKALKLKPYVPNAGSLLSGEF